MLHVKRLIDKVASTDTNVLLEGERGTGKNLCARTIHNKSGRSSTQMLSFLATKNGFLLPNGEKSISFENYLKNFSNNTIFIDEISEMSEEMQDSLFRLLDVDDTFSSKKFRLITATSQPLDPLVREKKFREDLYYRICVIRINLPTLRERKEDIPLLIDEFVKKYCPDKYEETSFTTDALAMITTRSWPGNLRELESCVQYAIVNAECNIITEHDLPLWFTGAGLKSNDKDALHETLSKVASELLNFTEQASSNNAYCDYISLVTKPLLLETVKRTDGNKSEAAKLLGINRNTLRKLLKENEIEQ